MEVSGTPGTGRQGLFCPQRIAGVPLLPPCPQESGDAPTFLLVWGKRRGGQRRVICGLGMVLTQGTEPRGALTCSFWVITRTKGRWEKASAPLCGMEQAPCSLGGVESGASQSAGGMIHFTNQTSGRAWGSHTLIISLNAPIARTESRFSSFYLFAPPLPNPSPQGVCRLQIFAGCCRLSPTSSSPHHAMHVYPENHLSPPKTFLSTFPLTMALLTVWQWGQAGFCPASESQTHHLWEPASGLLLGERHGTWEGAGSASLPCPSREGGILQHQGAGARVLAAASA